MVEGKLSFDYRYSRPQKQRGKSPPRTGHSFDENFGVKTATKVRKGNTFHSSRQISNNVDWEKVELKVSERSAAAFSAHFFIRALTIEEKLEEGRGGGGWRGRFFGCGPFIHQEMGKLL